LIELIVKGKKVKLAHLI